MLSFLSSLWRNRFPYEPLIRIELSRSRLIHNLHEFQRLAPQGRVAPVLKSNAYGHGLFEITRILEDERRSREGGAGTIPFFVVDSYFEARALRSEGIHTPILVIGYTRPEIILTSRLREVSYAVTSLDMLRSIESAAARATIHLKIDIGMNRQGIRPEEIDEAIGLIKKNGSIRLGGACGHFSDADNADSAAAEGQVTVWNACVKKIRDAMPRVEYFHVSNTYGHRFAKMCDANVSRLGIGLYGLADGSTFEPALDLKPVLSMKTIVTSVKEIKRGEAVGYGGTFKADRDMRIATVPVGYYEALDRRLSNNGSLQVGVDLVPCPIVGRVSMNVTTVDVTRIEGAKIGTPVIVISDDSEEPNCILEMAKKCGAIPYEITVHIPGQLKRAVV